MKRIVCLFSLVFFCGVTDSHAASVAPALEPGIYRCLIEDEKAGRLVLTAGAENYLVAESFMPHMTAIEYQVRLLADSGSTVMILQPLR
jgi:hypothetical protein